MSGRPRGEGGDPARRAVELLGALMAHGESAGAKGAVLAQVLAEARRLDPALQRRIALAMRESGGDPAALRAILMDEPVADAVAKAASRTGARPPTVVDARGGTPWLAIVAALAGVLLVVAYVATRAGQ